MRGREEEGGNGIWGYMPKLHYGYAQELFKNVISCFEANLGDSLVLLDFQNDHQSIRTSCYLTCYPPKLSLCDFSGAGDPAQGLLGA